ncbi:penicillin-binding protein 1C [Rhodoferax sp. BLA1]|uniref:penicillin-binding protein 1C n=1 Tax=Rhodoferax sp. BLA1 TaxID=2576062 RepID=UPI0015D23C8B|nr:penicillin-binding protein 1C [Rhodoferax sp. BLA1]
MTGRERARRATLRRWASRASASFLIAGCTFSAWASTSFNDVKAAWKPSDTQILDRHGQLLQRVRTDASVRRGQWLALADISPAMRSALVLSEDKRFYEHSGVDWQAVSAAAWANLWNTKTRGASTLTMQLAGLLDDDLKRGSGGRSVLQKVHQTVSAQWLERRWRKDQILEAYLNLVPLKGELVGIDALSQTLFGKAAHGLDEREAAVATALVRAPNAAPKLVAQRACGVLKALHNRNAPASCDALEMFTTGALQRRDYGASEGVAPHAARQVLRDAVGQAAPTRITTSLSAPLQRFAVQTLQQHLRELVSRHVEDGALVVLDNATGQVLAWVGSSGELSNAAEVDGVTALRQPGSTLKPFLYAQAMAERRITAATLLEDSAAQIQTTSGLYIPQNYDHQFKGWVSARTALGASLNVPAVRTLVMVSPDAFHKQLVGLGLPLKESGDYYGYSLALGSAEVSLLALSNAYRALANGGRTSATTLMLGAKPTMRAALDPRAAFIVGDILSDPMARARTFGADSILATRFWSAVKTGTSKDMRDNWALGYSQHYTVGVWVGNASGAPMWDVSGTSGAAPIWAAVMHYLHQSQPSHAPRPPAGVVQVPVQFAEPNANPHNTLPLEAKRSEWFIQGTQQTHFAIDNEATNPYKTWAKSQKGLKSADHPGARITTPTNGTIVALDPDIPPSHQRITFKATGSGGRWLVDGKVFATGTSAQWLPWPGRHVVQITDARGCVLDNIQLEVRGAGVVNTPDTRTKPRPRAAARACVF